LRRFLYRQEQQFYNNGRCFWLQLNDQSIELVPRTRRMVVIEMVIRY